MNASSQPPNDPNHPIWYGGDSGPGWSPTDRPIDPYAPHRAWCTAHDYWTDDPITGEPVEPYDACTTVREPVPGLALMVSQERGQAEPVVAVEHTREGYPQGQLTPAQARIVYDALGALLADIEADR